MQHLSFTRMKRETPLLELFGIYLEEFMQNTLRFVAKVSCLALILVLVAGMAFGQTSNGTIAGVVTDITGAAITNAKVTATSNNTGEVRTTNTNAVGAYR